MAGGQKHMIVIRPVEKGAAPGERLAQVIDYALAGRIYEIIE